MNLVKKVKGTLVGLKKARKSVKGCKDFEPEPCREAQEVIKTSLYEILLTHPQFSWLVTDPDVRAHISIQDRGATHFSHRYWDEALQMTDEQTAHIMVNQREKCSE